MADASIDPITVADWLAARDCIAAAYLESTGLPADLFGAEAKEFAVAVMARLASLTPPLLVVRDTLVRDEPTEVP